MPYKDPVKQREAEARSRKRRWEEGRGFHYERRQKLLAIVNEAKDVPCLDCGESYPCYVMDFDHVRGEKLGNVAALVGQSNEKKLRDEIAKCEIVCANCHRERTWGKG